MAQTYTPDEMEAAINNTSKGDKFTVVYDSANSEKVQEKTGEVLEAGDTWNGKQWEVEFKHDGKIYRFRMDKEGSRGSLEKVQYDWQAGERVNTVGTVRLTDNGVGSDGVLEIRAPASDDGIEFIKNGENGESVFETADGFRVVVESYDDANGARVVVGEKYVSETDINQIENNISLSVDS